MASWIWGSSLNPQLEELVEKACSPLNLPWPESEDIALNLEICDLIRSKSVPPKSAMQSLKTRLASKNARVQMAALGLTDTCIKNGGDHFLQEIASKDFVGEMVALIKAPSTVPQVREMALNLFQQWALVFETKSNLSYLPDNYRDLKANGVSFPPPPKDVSNHLLTTATPPTWIDAESCMRCRSAFTFTNRKHHCRNCGLVFDQACSSKTMPLPSLGIMQEVRVCEPCYQKGGRGGKLSKNDPNTPLIPAKRTIRAEQFDADLQRAIALSLVEGSSDQMIGSHPGMVGRKLEGVDTLESEDDELRLAIEASLADMQRTKPSAPGAVEEEEADYKPLPTYDLSPRETETMLTFAQTVEHAVGFGDRDLRRFPHVYPLHEQAQGLAGKLQRNVEEKATKQYMLAEMHDRLMLAVRRYDHLLEEQEARNHRQEAERYRFQPRASLPAVESATAPYDYSAGYRVQPHYPPIAPTESGPRSQYVAAQGPYPIQDAGPSISVPSYAYTTPSPNQTTHSHVVEDASARDRLREGLDVGPTNQSRDVSGYPYAVPQAPSSRSEVPPSMQPSQDALYSQTAGNHGGQHGAWATDTTHRAAEALQALPDAPNHAPYSSSPNPTTQKKEFVEEALLIEL